MSLISRGMGPRSVVYGGVASALLVSLFAWSLAVPFASTAAAQTTDAPPQQSLADVVETVAPAVVTVYNLDALEGMSAGSQPDPIQGIGTGFIIDTEGHVVTNWHVTTGGEAYAVIFSDGTSVEAELIGEDPRDDLAVVKIAPDSVPATVTFGDSDALRPGEPVFAIGSPLGAFANTVTEGIVSGLGRDQLGGLESFCQNYADLIQHDAAINPGNSGGPLFNMAGEVIGVNTLGLPTDQSGLPLQGLFFAVPGNLVRDVAQQLIQNGSISAPYIGISSASLDPAVTAANDLPVDQGNFVQQVEEGSPAEDAGLREGDIITALDGTEITVARTLPNILLDYQPADEVELTIIRDGDEQSLFLTLGEAPERLLEDCQLEGP